MKNIVFALFVLMLSATVSAQEVDIPLFDEFEPSVPNIGRNAPPLEKLIVTPEPLPRVEIDLGTTKLAPAKAEAPKNTQPAKKPAASSASKRTQPISLSKETADDERLSQQLKEELARAKREEEEKRRREAEASARRANQQMSSQIAENLFGKTHDVFLFDVSGMALGLTPDEIRAAADENGYQVTAVEEGIPLFRTSYYENRCRTAGVVMPEAVKRCILEAAESDGMRYISSMSFIKPAAGEKMQVLFSTPATDNVSYKIFYENEGDNSLNFTRRNLAKKKLRKDAFWQQMFDVYGLPDDSEKLIWGDPQKAYMKASMQGSAYNAYIVLEDKEIQDQDYFEAETDSKELHHRQSFTFGGAREED